MGSLASNLKTGKVSYGINVQNPDQIDLVARLGMDFASMSMQAQLMEWQQVAHMCTSCQRWGMSGVVTVQQNVWAGDYDPRLSVDTHKALSLGAAAVAVSVHGPREVEELMEVEKDFVPKTKSGSSSKEDEPRMIIPKLECQSAFDTLEEILSVPGLKMVYVCTVDTSRVLGVTKQFEHPKLWAHLKWATELATKHGVAAMSNPGYEPVSDTCLEAMMDRSNRLVGLGVKAVSLQSTMYMINASLSRCMAMTGSNLPG